MASAHRTQGLCGECASDVDNKNQQHRQTIRYSLVLLCGTFMRCVIYYNQAPFLTLHIGDTKSFYIYVLCFPSLFSFITRKRSNVSGSLISWLVVSVLHLWLPCNINIDTLAHKPRCLNASTGQSICTPLMFISIVTNRSWTVSGPGGFRIGGRSSAQRRAQESHWEEEAVIGCRSRPHDAQFCPLYRSFPRGRSIPGSHIPWTRACIQ